MREQQPEIAHVPAITEQTKTAKQDDGDSEIRAPYIQKILQLETDWAECRANVNELIMMNADLRLTCNHLRLSLTNAKVTTAKWISS